MRISRGDTLVPFEPQIMKSATDPFKLNGYTVEVTMVDGNGEIKGGGLMTIDNAEAGQCHYDFEESEVAVPGTYALHTKYTKTATGQFAHLDPEPLIIEWAP